MKHTFVVLAYKESKYLEDCIKSVLNQKYKSNVIIATSTPNDYIKTLAKKYNLKVIENKEKKGIGYDFDFAISCGQTKLVTVAHQDDIYESDYSKKVVEEYKKYKDSIIIFTDYYEIKHNQKVFKNTNLRIKRILLFLVKHKNIANKRFVKRSCLAFGDAICCPAVTFVKDVTGNKIFESDMKCDIDWLAWERLSNNKGRFVFINESLMGHRVYEESTTSQILKEDARSREDYEILKKFWPRPIAKLLTKLYKNSEKSNNK